MKVKTRVKLLLLLIAVFAAALIAGCKIGEKTGDEFLKENDADGQVVTYYANDANGGSFSSGGKTVRNWNYKAGSEVALDVENIDKLKVENTGFTFGGWYYVQLDGEGKPMFEADGVTPKATDVRADEKPIIIQENQHIYLCAIWTLDFRLEYILVTDDGASVEKEEGDPVKNGGVIYEQAFGNKTQIVVTSSMPSSTSHTFLAIYEDEACTKLFNGSVQRPPVDADPETDNPKVYAKYIKGEWTVVKTANDATRMFNDLSNGKKYYLFNDVDCKGRNVSLNSDDMNSIIEGNGHKISNIGISGYVYSGESKSLFGELTSSASIKELTLENVVIVATVRPQSQVSVHLISAGAEEGAKIENLTINGASLTVLCDDSVTVFNIQKNSGGEYDTTRWIGGDNDSEFFAKFTKLKLNDATLKMGRRAGDETQIATYSSNNQ